MAKYESSVKQICAPQSAVYAKLSDLSNLATIKERINDPAIQERMAQSGQVPADKLDLIKEKIEQMEFTQDSVSVNVAPLGQIKIDIIEREPGEVHQVPVGEVASRLQGLDSDTTDIRHSKQDSCHS